MHVRRARRWPLKYVLLVPFFALMLTLAGIIGWSSFSTGAEAVNDLDNQLLADMAHRVDQAVADHLKAADVILATIAPEAAGGAGSAFNYADDLALEARFFELTAISEGVRYIYLGRPNGDFVGVEREPGGSILAKFRNASHPQRINYAIRQPGDRDRIALIDPDYDPRTRPWYTAAMRARGIVWSPLYVSYAKKDLMVTRAKPVLNGREIAGVAAIDVPLDALSRFLRKLSLSANGVAFIMEPDGRLIATSTSEPPYVLAGDGHQDRLSGRNSKSPLLRATVGHLLAGAGVRVDGATVFDQDGETVHVAVQRMHSMHGLDWVIAVAAPQSDFTGNIVKATARTVSISLVVLLVIVLLGLAIVRWVTSDLARLTAAAERFGHGEAPGSLPVKRGDEIGVLARAFSAMATEITDLISAIRRNNEQLEANIAARTRVLSEQNKRLAEEVRERKAAEHRNLQLFNIVEQTDEGILVCDADARVRYVNPAFTRLTGYELDDMQEGGGANLLAPGRYDGPVFDLALQQEILRTVRAGKTYRGVLRARRKSGESYHAEITITPVLDEAGRLTALTAIERDVSQREEAREAVLNRLQIDSLTGLLNRESIAKRLSDLNRENHERRQVKPRVALLFMDLDGFKSVNDTWGHEAGDATLIEAANRIQGCVRASDAVARLGGDEFVAVLGGAADRAMALAVAAKIEAAFAAPFTVADEQIRIGVSIGIGVYPDDAQDVEALMRVADKAMYAAKRNRQQRQEGN